LENLLKKEVKFQWNEECQQSLDTLKHKLVTTLILVFPYWKKEFHVHVDASSIALGIVLAHPGEGDLDHPISFARRKLSSTEQNYTTTERRIGNGVCIAESLDITFWDHTLRCIQIILH
jgi:hypothetical protein